MALNQNGTAPTPQQYRKGPCKRPPVGTSRDELRAIHREKVARKARLRAQLYPTSNDRKRVRALLGVPAGINRWGGKPHKHEREIARRLRRSQADA